MSFDLLKFTEKINILFEGSSQKELAEKLGISQTMVSALKKGKIQSPGADIVCRIATTFDVTPDWLLGVITSDQNPNIEKIEHLIGINDNDVELLGELKAKGEIVVLSWMLENYRAQKENGNEDISLWSLLDKLIYLDAMKSDFRDKLDDHPNAIKDIKRGNEVIAKDVFMPDYMIAVNMQRVIGQIDVILNDFLDPPILDVMEKLKKVKFSKEDHDEKS